MSDPHKATDMPINFDGSFILALLMAVCTWVATWVNLKIKGDVQSVKSEVDKANFALQQQINVKLDEFRRDIATGFLPQTLAQEQRNSMNQNLIDVRREVETNRGRIHEISGQIMAQVTGEIFRINSQLTDKARRMATMEARFDAMHSNYLSLERQLEELAAEVRDLHNHK